MFSRDLLLFMCRLFDCYSWPSKHYERARAHNAIPIPFHISNKKPNDKTVDNIFSPFGSDYFYCRKWQRVLYLRALFVCWVKINTILQWKVNMNRSSSVYKWAFKNDRSRYFYLQLIRSSSSNIAIAPLLLLVKENNICISCWLWL